ncbi:MAG: transposase [Gammaproteobacteria bacterium]
MSAECRALIAEECALCPPARLSRVLGILGIARSVWYAKPVGEPRKPGRKSKGVPEELAARIKVLAEAYPWWGYKRIAVIARREGLSISNKQVYRVFKVYGLLQKKRVRDVAIYQAARLFELLPQAPNELWQADVTYLHIPGHGWWYAVTVIDYYSRYLLACHFTPSYTARDVVAALDCARAEAERLHGPLSKTPFLVTDNGPSFLARRFQAHIRGQFAHVRIAYRTPTQLGLLERFHQTLKNEEVYWKLYQSPSEARESLEAFRCRYNEVRPHWALMPQGGGDVLTPTDVYVHGQAVALPKWQGWAKAAREKLQQLAQGGRLPEGVLGAAA